MKIAKLFLIVGLLCFFATSVQSYEYSKNNSHELSVYIHNLLLSVKPECQDVSEIESLPCKWKKRGVNFRKAKWRMEGKSYIIFNGEFSKNFRKGKPEELPWEVIIEGSMNKVVSISLSPDELAFGKKGYGAGFELSNALSAIPDIKITKLLRRAMPGARDYFYLIQLPNTKPLLAESAHNVGSGDHTTVATFYYDIPDMHDKLLKFIDSVAMISKGDDDPSMDDYE